MAGKRINPPDLAPALVGPARHPFGAALAFWSLLPLAAVQGLLLRRRALRLPPPPGNRSGFCGTAGAAAAELHLLALGDSIIAGIGADARDQTLPVQLAQALSGATGRQVNWHAEGTNGAAVGDLLQRLRSGDTVAAADVILVSIGVNDVTGLSLVRRWRGCLVELVGELRRRWPQALVVFAGLPPMGQFPLPPQPLRFSLGRRAATFDQVLRDTVGDQARMIHVPTRINPREHTFCPDGFHPSIASYAIWARELCSRILPLLNSTPEKTHHE